MINDRIDAVTQGLPRPDRVVRPLPRPHVRPDPDEGLLRAARHLREHCRADREAGDRTRPIRSCKAEFEAKIDRARSRRTATSTTSSSTDHAGCSARRPATYIHGRLRRPQRRHRGGAASRATRSSTDQKLDARRCSMSCAATPALAMTTVFGPFIELFAMPATIHAMQPGRRRDRAPAPSNGDQPDRRRRLQGRQGRRPSTTSSQIYDKLFSEPRRRRRKAYLERLRRRHRPRRVAASTPSWSSSSIAPFERAPGVRADHRRPAHGGPAARRCNSRATPGFDFAKINELELTHAGSAAARAMVVDDAATPQDSPVFIRGQAETRGDIVPRRFLEISRRAASASRSRKAAAASNSPRPSPARTTRSPPA